MLEVERKQFSLIWHQLCLLKQGQLNIALQLLRIDSTLGMRALLGRDDIHAEWVGEAVQFWSCRNVTPTVIHINGNVNGTCYQYTPVQIQPEDGLLFVSPGSRDLIDSSPKQDCGHASLHLFQDENGNWFSADGLVHVTELPIEIQWKGLWDAFTFNAPSLFQNHLAGFLTTFYSPRYHSLRVYEIERTLDNLVNYTASMSLDPLVLASSIRGVGEGIGSVLSGAGSAIGHVVTGIGSGIGGVLDGILKGPLQIILNILIIGVVLVVVLLLLKFGITKCLKNEKIRDFVDKRFRWRGKGNKHEAQKKENQEEIEMTEIKVVASSTDDQQKPFLGYEPHYPAM